MTLGASNNEKDNVQNISMPANFFSKFIVSKWIHLKRLTLKDNAEIDIEKQSVKLCWKGKGCEGALNCNGVGRVTKLAEAEIETCNRAGDLVDTRKNLWVNLIS